MDSGVIEEDQVLEGALVVVEEEEAEEDLIRLYQWENGDGENDCLTDQARVEGMEVAEGEEGIRLEKHCITSIRRYYSGKLYLDPKIMMDSVIIL